jgi:hypothetical protein
VLREAGPRGSAVVTYWSMVVMMRCDFGCEIMSLWWFHEVVTVARWIFHLRGCPMGDMS